MTSRKIMKYLVIIGIILIPVIYSFFYLKAFWDPYSNLNDMKIALVNNDVGNETENLGNDLVQKLIEKDTLTIDVVDEQIAHDGLVNQKYYASITIPSNFTETLNSGDTTNKQITKIIYSPNQKKNYLASQIIDKFIINVEKELNSEVTEKTVSKLSKELNDVPNKMEEISTNLGEVESGTNELQNGINQLSQGVDTLNSNYKKFNEGINNLKQGSTELNNGLTNLSNGLTKLNTEFSMAMASFDGSPESIAKLNELSNNVKASLQKMEEVSKKLNKGSTDLENGVKEVSNKSTDVLTGIEKIDSGVDNALQGSKDLNSGVEEFKATVDTKISETKENLQTLEGLSEFASESVVVEQVEYAKIDNYGLAFTPYFMSLSLWVGGIILIMVLYYDSEDRFKILGRNSNRRILRSVIYTLLAVIQAIVLAGLLKLGLGFEVTNIWLYYLSCILVSVSFLSIIQFFMFVFKDIGKFLSILLLILQLSASGGTFPIETLPAFFQKIYTFMPMNYSIKLIKESIISQDEGLAKTSIAVLVTIFVVFLLATIIFDILRILKEKFFTKHNKQVQTEN